MSSETKSENPVPHSTRYEYTDNDDDVQIGDTTIKPTSNEKKTGKRKITIEVDEDDPCLKEKVEEKEEEARRINIPGLDPRFQQQNQTLRCWVMYTDFYRCEKILGDGSDACTWFKQVFSTMCPNDWIDRWEQYRTEGRFPWHKYKTQGQFPGDKYGV
ncbi:cytochrome c oxidase subunit 6B1 [Augochlora pura]